MQYDEIRVRIIGRDPDGITSAVEVQFLSDGEPQSSSRFCSAFAALWQSQLGSTFAALRRSLLGAIRDWESSFSYILDCNCKHMSGRYPAGTLIPSYSDASVKIAVGELQRCERNRKGDVVYPCAYTTNGARRQCNRGYEPR